MSDLTTLKDVERQIQSSGLGRISVGDTAPDPGTNNYVIERTTIEEIISTANQVIVSRIGRFYTTPLTLTNPETVKLLNGIATKQAAYEVILTIIANMTIDEIPAATKDWKASLEALMESIVPKGKTSALIGRDIILEGETLTTESDDPGTANVVFTDALPFGATG
jgi:hypothetical protein